MNTTGSTSEEAFPLHSDAPSREIANLRAPELDGPARAFAANIGNIVTMIGLPGVAARFSAEDAFLLLHNLAHGAETPQREIIVTPKALENAVQALLQSSPNMAVMIDHRARAAMWRMMHDARFEDSIRAFYAAAISGAWTAIECLSADLWEAAVNARPSAVNLGKLGEGKDKERADASIPLWKIARMGFDLRTTMGTILRERYDFTGVDGILKAYRVLLDERRFALKDAIDSPCLRVLEATRHVIVHRAAQIDSMYIRRWKQLVGEAPLLFQEGERVTIEPEIAVALVNVAIDSGCRLMRVLDEWVIVHGASATSD